MNASTNASANASANASTNYIKISLNELSVPWVCPLCFSGQNVPISKTRGHCGRHWGGDIGLAISSKMASWFGYEDDCMNMTIFQERCQHLSSIRKSIGILMETYKQIATTIEHIGNMLSSEKNDRKVGHQLEKITQLLIDSNMPDCDGLRRDQNSCLVCYCTRKVHKSRHTGRHCGNHRQIFRALVILWKKRYFGGGQQYSRNDLIKQLQKYIVHILDQLSEIVETFRLAQDNISGAILHFNYCNTFRMNNTQAVGFAFQTMYLTVQALTSIYEKGGADSLSFGPFS